MMGDIQPFPFITVKIFQKASSGRLFVMTSKWHELQKEVDPTKEKIPD